jgi:hypothetical protein
MSKQSPTGGWIMGRLMAVSVLAMSFGLATSAQRSTRSEPKQNREQSSGSTVKSLTPEAPILGILAAFDKYEVVGMDAAHGDKDLDDLILRLLREPSFLSKVDDVVVECGNSSYQSVLDRYIAGHEVTLREVRPVWRNTTQPMCSVSGFYEMLFPLIRRINQRSSTGKKLRVVAGDPPLNWSKVTQQSDVMLDRDASIASVMEKEVLSKHQRALMLFGTFHLFHANKFAPPGLESAVQRYEVKYPGVTMVIGSAMIFDAATPLPSAQEFEKRMSSFAVPSLFQNLQGTWLMNMNPYFFSKMVDTYLYFGPPDLLLAEPRPAEIFMNRNYMAELRRRAELIGDALLSSQTDPDQISDDNFNPFLYPPLFIQEPPKPAPNPN